MQTTLTRLDNTSNQRETQQGQQQRAVGQHENCAAAENRNYLEYFTPDAISCGFGGGFGVFCVRAARTVKCL